MNKNIDDNGFRVKKKYKHSYCAIVIKIFLDSIIQRGLVKE